MLTHLTIKNYLLIDNLELNLSSGLTIITGETGAGKSILLGAIGLLLGQRAETKVLFDSQTKCIIEGTFAISGYSLEEFFNAEELDYSETTLIRREISPAGKSRAFVNDTPVTLDVLKKITEQLVDIHSQHDSILLGEGAVQIELMDAFAGNSSLRSTYSQDFKAWKQAEASLENLVRRAGELRKEHDYDRYLWEELDKAQLIENEIEELEKELAILENAAEIKTRFIQAYQNLEGSEFSVLSLVNEASQLLYQVNRMTPVYKELSDRLENVLVELKDLSGEIGDVADRVEINEERLTQVNDRLDILYKLIKKHQVTTVDELITIREELRGKIQQFENLDADLQKAREEASTAKTQLLKSGRALSDTRKKAIPNFEKRITDIVKDLGITNADFQIQISEERLPSPVGLDHIEFLFSANKGVRPQPLKNVASGGEFSRLMLAFKYAVAGKKQLGTLIFDEIDSGISGEIARKMGTILQQMGRQHQLITITHLHQIAAFGNEHFYVYKDHSHDMTISRIKKLTEQERILELAQMIGGQNPSESVISNARELLEKSR